MMDFYFFVKTLILTLALIVVLQIRVGEKSLEEHATLVFQNSFIEKPLSEVANGGAKLARKTFETIQNKINGEKKKDEKPASEKKSGFRFNWNS